MRNRFLIGLDGGGSKTAGLFCDSSGRVSTLSAFRRRADARRLRAAAFRALEGQLSTGIPAPS